MLKGIQNEAKIDAEINGCRKKKSKNMPKSLKYQQNGNQWRPTYIEKLIFGNGRVSGATLLARLMKTTEI